MAFLTEAANRGSISTGYEIDNSVKVENDNREYFRWTNFSNYASSARKKKFSMSVWVKRTELDRQQIVWSTAQNGYLSFQADNKIKWQQSYGGVIKTLNTNRVFRDTNAWYHIILQVDTAQSTEADRTKLYINGVQETSFFSTTYPAQNAEAQNIYEQHLILGEWGGGSTGFSGYIAEHYFLSEVALVPSDVGEFDEDTGIWKPKAYDGTISSPSYFLEFQDGSDLGTATSGLDADYLNNITSADQATDTPTNNFCTWSPLWIYAYNLTISEGGQKVFANASNWQGAKGSVGLQNGRWYWEAKIPDANNGGFTGIQTQGESNIGSGNAQSNNSTYTRKADGWDLYYYGGSESSSSHGGGNMANNNIIGVFLDLESSTKTLRWFKNGSSYGSTIDLANQSTSFTTREVFPFYANITSGNGAYFNFGGHSSYTISSGNADANGYGNFEYSPSDGTYNYYSICTKNLAEFG